MRQCADKTIHSEYATNRDGNQYIESLSFEATQESRKPRRAPPSAFLAEALLRLQCISTRGGAGLQACGKAAEEIGFSR
jgi:hypothetical protein